MHNEHWQFCLGVPHLTHAMKVPHFSYASIRPFAPLPFPMIMEVENGGLEDDFSLLLGAIFHFHDYGRKGICSFNFHFVIFMDVFNSRRVVVCPTRLGILSLVNAP